LGTRIVDQDAHKAIQLLAKNNLVRPTENVFERAMKNLQSRRSFLATAGITVASVISPRLVAQPNPSGTPANGPGVRESIVGIAADHPVLNSYRKAITEMNKLDLSNPLSWRFQANMHGSNGDGVKDGWDWCQHANWWFLPWHRGYLYFFEKIVRKMSGDDSFRLPYWPWEQEGQNVLPTAFRDALYQGQPNPLYDRTRPRANRGGPLVPQDRAASFGADWAIAIAAEYFNRPDVPEQSFGGFRFPKMTLPDKPSSSGFGVMESHAHNMVHVAMGSGSNMYDPSTAARDPIFWLHHANVDRLWNRWLDTSGHRNPDPTSDKDWFDQQFPFYDETGKKVVVSVTDILKLAAAASRYDDDRRLFAAKPPAGTPPMNPQISGVASVQPALALGSKPLVKPLPVADDAKPKLTAALRNTTSEKEEPPAIVLRVEDIKPPANAAVVFEVFVTKKGDKPSKATYAGTITFFGKAGSHGHNDNGFTQGFDVTNLVQRIRRANGGALPDLDVAIVPHSTAGLSDEDLAKQDISIPISNITLKLVTAKPTN
jgi:tyrosinase